MGFRHRETSTQAGSQGTRPIFDTKNAWQLAMRLSNQAIIISIIVKIPHASFFAVCVFFDSKKSLPFFESQPSILASAIAWTCDIRLSIQPDSILDFFQNSLLWDQ
ncbi:hypothetical protein BPOR_0152g00010 [Botrytis porri]|uniref:Uncharacterized protein n=1 Tax=Botrytis porri TaxID=87229 RepID=A0A4Z1KVP0_9HELO|nr:hypothetical protein BPOR_0152g00010 [Botrytis porri]